MQTCVRVPLYRCSALLGVGSGGELSLFKQMERDSTPLRKGTEKQHRMSLSHSLTHTYTKSHFICSRASGGQHSSSWKYHLGNATQLDIIYLFLDPQQSLKGEESLIFKCMCASVCVWVRKRLTHTVFHEHKSVIILLLLLFLDVEGD